MGTRTGAEWGEPPGFSGVPDCIPHEESLPGMTPYLVSQLSGKTGSRYQYGCTATVAELADCESEPLQLLDWGLVWLSPDDLLQNATCRGPLYHKIVKLISGALHPYPELHLLRFLSECASLGCLTRVREKRTRGQSNLPGYYSAIREETINKMAFSERCHGQFEALSS